MLQTLCVNRAGSTPPTAADLTTGATITSSSASGHVIYGRCPVYHYGITYVVTGSNAPIYFNNTNLSIFKTHYLKNCALYLNHTGSSAWVAVQNCKAVLDNTTIQFGNTSQTISQANGELIWLNTASAIPGATLPTALFNPLSGGSSQLQTTVRGVDLSAITGSLVKNNNAAQIKILFDSCKIASGVTRYTLTSVQDTQALVELVNCYDGTNILSEIHTNAGDVTTEFTITLSSGATDNVGTFSHKMVSNTNIDKWANPLEGFWLDMNYTTTGSSKTATVEIISSTTLNNDEIALYLQYEGTSSSSVASFANSLPATVLTTASAVTSSTASWNAQPGSPVKQKLQVTFTPQTAGRLRGQVRLGKASTTVYVNPKITVT